MNNSNISNNNSITQNNITYLDSKLSAKLDEELMQNLGFTSQQLMEMAGISIADAIYNKTINEWKGLNNIIVISGPGNNGGDGLVAARHLKEYNKEFDITILYPKKAKDEINKGHLKTCSLYDINIIEDINSNNIDNILNNSIDKADIIIDSIFGYSFDSSREIKEPLNKIMQTLNKKDLKAKIVSVDVPSGWDVNKVKYTNSDNFNNLFCPDMLISLGTPKLCSLNYKGEHYLGGRFIPSSVLNKFNIKIPEYKDSNKYSVKIINN